MARSTINDWAARLRRLAATGEPQALEDLRQSLRHLTARDGAMARQADAVLALLDAYIADGSVTDLLQAAIETVGDDRAKQLTLEVFAIHDSIAADPDHIAPALVDRGFALARQLKDPGLLAYFSLLGGQLAYAKGDIATAKKSVLAAIANLQTLAQSDSVYISRLGDASVNGASFAALDGDFALARELYGMAMQLGRGAQLDRLASALAVPAPREADGVAAGEMAGRLLESGETLRALEWFLHAEQRLRASGDERALCGLLGDLAVSFRRVGNPQRAIAANRRAIELCRAQREDLHLARWSGNLGNLLLQAGDSAAARAAFEEALSAAHRTGLAEQIAIAENHLGVLLAREGRGADARERLGRARKRAGDSPISDLTRHNELLAQASGARAAVLAQRWRHARELVDSGLGLVDWQQPEERQIAADLLILQATIEEASADIRGAAASLDRAADVLDALGKGRRARELRSARARYAV